MSSIIRIIGLVVMAGFIGILPVLIIDCIRTIGSQARLEQEWKDFDIEFDAQWALYLAHAPKSVSFSAWQRTQGSMEPFEVALCLEPAWFDIEMCNDYAHGLPCTCCTHLMKEDDGDAIIEEAEEARRLL